MDGCDLPVLGLKPKPKPKIKIKVKSKQISLPEIEIESDSEKMKTEIPKQPTHPEPSVVLSKQGGLYDLQINYKGLTRDQYKAIMDLLDV